MGLLDAFIGQNLDVIEYENRTNKVLVYKFQRPEGNNEIKQGSKVIVREGQAVAFMKGGALADIYCSGTYSLNTGNFPILSSLGAFRFGFMSPVISDVYFISLQQFLDNKWGLKAPIMKRDPDMGMVRIRAFGKFGFRVVDPYKFMREMFGTKGIMTTFDVIQYLTSLVTEAFSAAVGAIQCSVLDLSAHYADIAGDMSFRLYQKTLDMGMEISSIVIEGISLPEDIQKKMDNQAGINIANQNMKAYMQYNITQSMRDAVSGDSELGAVAGMELAGQMLQGVSERETNKENNYTEKKTSGVLSDEKIEKLRNLKALLDEGILSEEEFAQMKKRILDL